MDNQSQILDLQHALTLIAGPCSAESYEQMEDITAKLSDIGITTLRAGVWKPRTRPDTFEGNGIKALEWIRELKKKYSVKFAIEVANASHVEQALLYDIDILWIGARTTVNPFGVQEVADALKGVDIPIMVKNPINPEVALWLGAIERIAKAGVRQISAIHRGFSSYRKSKYRNEPLWQIPIELKRNLPEVPLICDPSHISGTRDMIADICQRALNLGFQGLIIESHPAPDHALSDPKQQVTPEHLIEILNGLIVRERSSNDALYTSRLEMLRDKIDHLDHDLLELLSQRLKVIEEIGEYKKDNNVAILQLERWKEILSSRPKWGEVMGINPKYIEELYQLVHTESIRVQTEILNSKTNESRKS